jgi:hypothetical protein
MVYRVHMITKHFHLHFTANRIFNNLLLFSIIFIFLSLSICLPQKRNLGFYSVDQNKTKQNKKITQSNSIILSYSVFCPFVPHCTPNIVWFNRTNINLTRRTHTNCSHFTSFPIHIHFSLFVHSFFCT